MNDETRQAAIEAGARALWDREETAGYDEAGPQSWEWASDYWRNQFLADARAAYDAMAPIIAQRLLAGLEDLEGYDESGILVRPSDVEKLIRSVTRTEEKS